MDVNTIIGCIFPEYFLTGCHRKGAISKEQVSSSNFISPFFLTGYLEIENDFFNKRYYSSVILLSKGKSYNFRKMVPYGLEKKWLLPGGSLDYIQPIDTEYNKMLVVIGTDALTLLRNRTRMNELNKYKGQISSLIVPSFLYNSHNELIGTIGRISDKLKIPTWINVDYFYGLICNGQKLKEFMKQGGNDGSNETRACESRQ